MHCKPILSMHVYKVVLKAAANCMKEHQLTNETASIAFLLSDMEKQLMGVPNKCQYVLLTTFDLPTAHIFPVVIIPQDPWMAGIMCFSEPAAPQAMIQSHNCLFRAWTQACNILNPLSQ